MKIGKSFTSAEFLGKVPHKTWALVRELTPGEFAKNGFRLCGVGMVLYRRGMMALVGAGLHDRRSV